MKMKMPYLVFALALLAVAPAASGHTGKKKVTAASPAATYMNADEIKWSDAPPDFPKGAQVAVLYGDPSKKGAFTLRFKMPDRYVIAPHWHSQAERLTVVSGNLLLHMGDTMDSKANDLGSGAFHFLPAKMHHAAEAKGETVVQVEGQGPFDINYLNPADNPKNKATASRATE